MPQLNHLTFGTAAYAVVTNREYNYSYVMRLADRAVTHLSAIGPGHDEASALYAIYQQDPALFETICSKQMYYAAPKWRMN